MATLKNLKPTGQPGVFYKEHKTRKHGVKFDRQWVIRQTLGGRTRVSVLGWASEGMSLAEALNKATEYKKNFKWNQLNPNQRSKPLCLADEKSIAQIKKEENPLFKTFAERFLTNYVRAKLKPKTVIEYERHIRKHFIPAWGDRRIIDIERKQIIKLIENLAKEAPIQANRKLATLKKLFSYAVNVGVLKTNPASGIKPPASENIKERVLDINELAALFNFLEKQNNRDTADILRLIALTGQRPGEVAQMRIVQLKEEFEYTWWHIPSSETKTKTAHQIFLNNQALHIIQGRITELGLNNYIFPATKLDGTPTHMRVDVLSRRVTRILPMVKKEGVEKFTAHDLRRSAATGIAQLGHAATVPDILNHKPQGITRQVYDKYSRKPEIKSALTAWGETVQRAIDGTKADVVPIAQQSK